MNANFDSNSMFMYVIVAVVIAFVIVQSIVFLLKAWRRGRAIGLSAAVMRKTVVTSAMFTIAPAVAILLGVIALSRALGFPLPWLRLSVIGGGEARSVCATGYLSLIRILLQNGLISPEGIFRREARTPLAGLLAKRLREEAGGLRFALAADMDLDAQDVEAVLAVKAAFSLTLERLLAHAGVSSAGLRRIFVAGALGSHVNAGDLEALGFLPSGLGARLSPLGNSSLAGAELFLREPAWRERIARWTPGCSVLDLAADGDFQAGYMRHMRFAW